MATDQPFKSSKQRIGTLARDTTDLTRKGVSKYDGTTSSSKSNTHPGTNKKPGATTHKFVPGKPTVPQSIKSGALRAPRGANVSESTSPSCSSLGQEKVSSEAKLNAVRANPSNARKIARERIRTRTRRVIQSVQLGGYWTFRGGKPVFVSTVGRKASVKGTRRKINRPPSPNQTVNTASRKTKEKLVKRPPKMKVPPKIKKVRGYK
jgi:hypothetical protein